MKKFLKKSMLLFFVLLLAISMIACEARAEEENDDISFSVMWNGTVVELGKPAASVLTALGEAQDEEEVFDCGEGNSRIKYQYSSLILYTMKSDGQEVIDQIEVLDDLCETKAKIAIGSEESAVRNAYGVPSKEENGVLTYTSGDKYLIVDVENGKVTGIGLLRKTS